jgi:hypothetical protein
MLWKRLGDEEHLITLARDGFADHQLRGARAIHLRGVDVVHSKIEAAAQGGDRRCAIVPVDVPGPLADHADLALRGPKRRLLTLVRVPWVALRSMTPPACAAE